jgi:signal transduction histidine kinase
LAVRLTEMVALSGTGNNQSLSDKSLLLKIKLDEIPPHASPGPLHKARVRFETFLEMSSGQRFLSAASWRTLADTAHGDVASLHLQPPARLSDNSLSMTRTAAKPFDSAPDARADWGPFQSSFVWPGTRHWPARLRPAILVVLLWTAVGLLQAAPDALKGFQWPSFAGKLIEAWCWAILTPAILLADRHLHSAQPSVPRLTIAHFLLSFPFSLAHTYISGLLEYPIEEIWWSPIRSTEFAIFYFLGGWTTYAAFVGALQALKFYNRFMTSQVELERVERRLLESHLNALRLQLEPHFLFNTLNAISSELSASPAQAREMIEDLGALLRRSLDCQDRMEITLAQELALLDHYLSIQKLRFGTRIDIRLDIEPALLSAMVPSMLLQPLVENAIRHGIEGRLSGGMVALSARRSAGFLQIEIVDDGIGLPRNWRMDACAGLGVRVTRERLEALYSNAGGNDFTICRRKGGGTKVAIRIPLHTTGEEFRATAA